MRRSLPEVCLGAKSDSPKKIHPLYHLLSLLWLVLSPLTMRSRTFLGFPNRHKYVLVAAILTLFILFKSVPIPTSRLDPRAEKSYGESRPRYLHRSTFRADPDYEYEIKLSNALRAMEIEREMRHDEDATDTLWQIMLPGVSQRSDDSVQFEQKNSEWKYKVRPTRNILYFGN